METTDSSSEEPQSVARKLVEIPREQGLANVRAIMEKETLNRYQAKNPELNFLLNSEREFAKLVGMKYAVSLNSGGIAISLGLEGMKRVCFPDDSANDIRVYSNAFTFNAVPSACVVAGFHSTLKLVKANEYLTIDLDHLERCINDDLDSGRFVHGKMILVLSYMRGRVPDMGKVLELCAKYDVKLLEDSAHGYGCSFDGKPCGSFGMVSTISTQANKLVNTGEGGMVFTNNDELQAFFIFSAGSYEELWRKHEEMAPPEEIALKYKFTTVNKSVRMTNIQGALLYPQLAVMGDRIEQHNSMYDYLASATATALDKLCGPGASKRVEFVAQAHKLVGPVYDSMQVRLRGEGGELVDHELLGLNAFLKMMQGRKYTIAKFNDPANARNFVTWQYLESSDILPEELPQTTRHLLNVCDLRLLCHDTEREMDTLARHFAECFKECLTK
jgi:dTDP-4-amino-4,6-dideoxygalactose transaminase